MTLSDHALLCIKVSNWAHDPTRCLNFLIFSSWYQWGISTVQRAPHNYISNILLHGSGYFQCPHKDCSHICSIVLLPSCEDELKFIVWDGQVEKQWAFGALERSKEDQCLGELALKYQLFLTLIPTSPETIIRQESRKALLSCVTNISIPYTPLKLLRY